MRGTMLALALAAACTPKTYAGTEDVTLPTSTSPVPAPKVGDPNVRIVSYGARRGLLVDGAVVVGPASPLGGSHSGGLLVSELASAMGTGTPSSRRVVLAVDENVPYELVARLVYTVGQVGVDSIEFLVRGADGARVLALSMPRSGERVCVAQMVADVAPALRAALGGDADGGPRRDASRGGAGAALGEPALCVGALDRSSEALCLTVHVSSRGVRVAAAGRALTATCDGASSSEAPPFSTARDPGLRACMARLASHPAASAGRVTVAADRDVPLRDLVAALDAVRVDGMAEPALGMAR